MKPVYLVLGMHRSGTSAATQLLALAGCGLPKDVVPADDHNQRGYFEPWRVAVFNDERLRAATSAWDDPFAFPYREAADPQAWQARAAQLLAGQFDLDSAPLLKDPRISVLMPMWRPVLERAGLSPLCVIPVRHPLEVAGSLAKRDGFVTEKSLLVWCAYMLAAEAYSRGLPRVFVPYDALIQDWRRQAARIEAAHGVKLPRLDEAAAAAIDDFLSPDLRHHQGDRDLASLSPAGALAAPLYDWLMAACRDQQPEPAALDQAAAALGAMAAQMGEIVSPLARDLDQARADLLYARQLLEQEREQFAAQLRAAQAAAKPAPPALTPEQERELAATAFDPAYYLARYPDVAEFNLDPLEHFLQAGWREHRDPSASFSVMGYLDLNPDIADAGVNPLIHYLRFGREEGRQVRSDLGFRVGVLHHALSLEQVVETVRGSDVPGGPPEALLGALAPLGPRLMITVSQDAYTDHVGGVQLCLKRESAALAQRGWSRLHLYPALPMPVADFETLDPVVGLLVDGEHRGHFRTVDLAAALAAGAASRKATTFAVHSFLGHSIPAVSDVLAAAGASAGFYWLHDQTSICASYALLRDDVAFCGAPPPDSQACSICIYGLRRRVQMADHAAFFDRFAVTVAAPSQAQLDLWAGATSYRAAAAVVHPHATLVARETEVAPSPAGGPLKVAFLGLPGLHKGWPIFKALASRFSGDPRYAFVHLGKQETPPPPIDFIPVSPAADELSPMIAAVEAAGVDVALLLSICPETFGFTAYEAAAAGALVVALPDSSAVARFAADPAFGVVAQSEGALAEMFESGELLASARARRAPPLFDLAYSRMTTDLMGEAAE